MKKCPFIIDYETMTLVPPPKTDVLAVKGENMSTKIYFKVDKAEARCEWDLSSGIWEIKYVNACGETGRQVLTDIREGEYGEILLGFSIPDTLTKEAGRVLIELCCWHPELDQHWHVSPYKGKIGNFYKVAQIQPEDPQYDVVDQVLAMFKKYPDPNSIVGRPVDIETERLEKSSIVTFLQDYNEIGQIEVFDGIDGKSFTFEDLTPEQKEELKGETGETKEIDIADLDEIMLMM